MKFKGLEEALSKIDSKHLKRALNEIDELFVLEGLERTNYNQLRCAELLGLNRGTVIRKIKQINDKRRKALSRGVANNEEL